MWLVATARHQISGLLLEIGPCFWGPGFRSGAGVVPPIGGLVQSRCSADARTEAHTLSVTLTD